MSGHFVRALSAVTLLVSLLLTRVLSGIVGAPEAVCLFGLSSQVLLLVPRRGGPRRLPALLCAMVSAGCIAVALMSALPAGTRHLRTVIYGAMIPAPAVTWLVANAWSMTKDMDFLCGRLPGWEATVSYVSVMWPSVSVFVFLVLLVAVSGPDGGVGPWKAALYSFMGLLYAFFCVRHLSGAGSALAGGLRERTRERMRLTLRPEPDGDISLNYRMLYSRMKEYMETKKPFTSQMFCLDDMAKAMYTNSAYVSRIINTCTGANFSKYVNNYRVRYAMDLYRSDPNLKASELCQLSGFNTKVTFNMSFKLFTGSTPGEWCRHYRESMLEKKAPSSLREQER